MITLRWRRGFSSDLVRALSWRRRTFAMIAAAAAALAIIHAARPAPPATVAVVRATGPVAAGTTLLATHLVLQQVVATAVPQDAVTRVSDAVGQRIIAGLSRGQVLTVPLLLTPRAVTGPGRVLTSLRLTEPGLIDLLRPGDTLDVLATDPDTGHTAAVADRVRVVALPSADGDDLGQLAAEPLLLVEIDRSAATGLAEAAASRRLTMLLR